MHMRFLLRRADTESSRRAEKHDEIYEGLDAIFTSQFASPVPIKSKIDTKFFLDEIADNFLEHDSSFDKANIDIWVDRDTLDVTVKVTHDGREFNPLDPNGPCENILAAADRLRMSPPRQDPHSHRPERFGLKYNLNSLNIEEEVI